jgi:Secretion system C-terminal sorting domain/Ig-like domain CHU_C associated/Purple acid Phosphatase, N-terminal domain
MLKTFTSPFLQRMRAGSKAFLATLSLLLLMLPNLNAQVSLYTFAQSSGTYTPITNGNVLGAVTTDDDIFSNLPIGFPFFYNGNSYTAFGINTNGWLYFGSAIGGSSYTSLSTGTTNNVFAALNYDLQGNPNTGELSYKTIGAAPNRTLVVQWKNFDSFSSTTNSDNYNFQIRLDETVNTLTAVYGSFVKDATVRQAQVGLRGASNADFNNRQVVAGVQTWSTTIAGATNAVTCELNTTPLVPASGQTFVWTPPVAPAVPTSLTFTAITTTGMTVNWVDNSTDELNFQVYRSTDNVNFTFAGTVASASTVTTGNPYNLVATGLASNTLYYWRVYALNGAAPSTPLTGQQATLAGAVCGTITIGPTGAFPSITAAIAAVVTNGISCPLIFELQAAYLSTVETFPIVVPFLGGSAVNTITVRPELGATNLSITSAALQTIDLNGATYFGFDGRPGGVGTTSQLTIANTATTGSAVRLINDAIGCGLNYINVVGVTTGTTNGVIAFGNASATGLQGNNNFYLTNSTITSGATGAQILLYATNTQAGTTTTGGNISNNNFTNWFSAAGINHAINIIGQHASWTIDNNNFYQTASRTFTVANLNSAITVNMTVVATGNFTITNNKVGGTAANASGTAWTDLGAFGHRFVGISVTTGVLGPNIVSNNLVTNFSYSSTAATTTGTGNWCGINLAGTNANFTVNANTIGSTTVNNQIVTTSTLSGGLIVGINSTASGNSNMITNNLIGGITANTSAATVSSSVAGIQVTSGSMTITGNTIGSIATINNMINAASTSATAGIVTGINCTSATAYAHNISNNTIANLTNQYAGTTTTGQTRGIVATGGTPQITNNIINALTNYSPQIGTTTAASVIGINQQSASTNGAISVSGNSITNLLNLSAAGNVVMQGIIMTGPATLFFNSKVNGNTISSLTAITAGAPVINGIYINGGIIRVYNNMVNLGLDPSNGPILSAYEFNGIFKATANRATIMHNTVNLQGNGVNGGAINTYAFRRSLNPAAVPSDSVFNNVFVNNRSNGSSTGTHYSVSINNTTNWLSNANIYYGTGVGYQTGAVGVTNYASIPLWSGGVPGQDINSFAVNPNFISTTNLHINNATVSVLESRGLSLGNILTDIDAQVRPGPAGSVNGGAFAVDLGADEFDGLPVTTDIGILSLTNPLGTGCHTNCEVVRVRLRNYSSSPLNMATNNVAITASTTGPNPQSFTLLNITSGILPGLSNLDTLVNACYDMSAVGTHVFNASASTGLDFITSNNGMTPVSIVIGGGVSVSNRPTLCPGDSSTITVSGQTNGGTIQWQSSPDNIVWTNIGGATTNPLNTGALLDTTYYRAMICGTYPSVSDTVRVPVLSNPVVTGDTVCGSGIATLTAISAGTSRWFPTLTGGALLQSGPTYSPFVNTTTTFYVENSTGTPPTAQITTYAAGNGSAGNIFSIQAINTITITGFDGHITTGPATWEIWYRPNDYYLSIPGSLNGGVANGWTLVGTAAGVPAAGLGNPTVLPIPMSITIPAGQRYSFIVTTTGTTLNYTNGTVNTIFPAGSNADFSFYQGYGGGYNAWTIAGRVWNGTIHYSSGCSSAPRVPVVATVTPAPVISAIVDPAALCTGDSAWLSVTSPNSGYAYTWSPAANLNTTVGDSAHFGIASPSGNFTYYVDASDGLTTCATRDTVTFTMGARPVFTATSINDTICGGDTTTVLMVPQASAVQIGTGVVQNSTTTYPAPYGNWYGGARHEMLILASELTAAGMSAGDISGMQFDVVTVNGPALQNLQIDLASTAVTDLITWQTPAFTTVFTSASYLPTVGLNTHNFSTPFYWDGVSNILIKTCFNNLAFTQNCIFNQTTTAFNSTIYFRADSDPTVCATTTVTAFINQRPNITLLRSFGTWQYSWTPAATVSSPTSSSTVVTPTITTSYVLEVTDSVSGCPDTDTVLVTTLPTPAPNFGPDGFYCDNASPLTLDAGSGPYTYVWQDASANQTFTVSAAGNYNVYVVDTASGCDGTDTLDLLPGTAPVFSLGADVSGCDGDTVSFTGPAGSYSYLWSTTDMTQGISAFASGNYELAVTDSTSGCVGMDTVVLTLNAYPVVNLGGDTTVCGSSFTFDAGNAGATYLWGNTDVTQTSTYTVSGQVTVDVTSNNCTSSDTTQLTLNALPAVSLALAQDTVCQELGSITLTGGSPAGGTYSGAGVTGTTFDPTVSGLGSQTITYTFTDVNGCTNTSTDVFFVDICTGIENPFSDASLMVFPNPTEGVFNLSIGNADFSNLTIQVVTMEGKVIFNENETEVHGQFLKTIDLSSYSLGVYFLKVTADGHTYQAKVVKNM